MATKANNFLKPTRIMLETVFRDGHLPSGHDSISTTRVLRLGREDLYWEATLKKLKKKGWWKSKETDIFGKEVNHAEEK